MTSDFMSNFWQVQKMGWKIMDKKMNLSPLLDLCLKILTLCIEKMKFALKIQVNLCFCKDRLSFLKEIQTFLYGLTVNQQWKKTGIHLTSGIGTWSSSNMYRQIFKLKKKNNWIVMEVMQEPKLQYQPWCTLWKWSTQADIINSRNWAF